MPHTVEPGMTRRNLTTVDGSRRERVKGYGAVVPVADQRQAPTGADPGLPWIRQIASVVVEQVERMMEGSQVGQACLVHPATGWRGVTRPNGDRSSTTVSEGSTRRHGVRDSRRRLISRSLLPLLHPPHLRKSHCAVRLLLSQDAMRRKPCAVATQLRRVPVRPGLPSLFEVGTCVNSGWCPGSKKGGSTAELHYIARAGSYDKARTMMG